MTQANGALAIIPARGGSKRIPRKNVRDFCGRPMLAWSVEAALNSRCFDRVVVSTDDPEIAEVAQAEGADIIQRPSHLADDFTPTVPVVVHAIDVAAADQSKNTSEVCCIYATAPFVTADSICRGLETLRSSRALFAFSATTYAFPIQRAMRLLPSGRVEMFQPKYALTRSQDLEEAYHDAGQFYWGSVAGWRSGKPIIGPDAAAVLLPRHQVQDIDTYDDWSRAEAMFRANKQLG